MMRVLIRSESHYKFDKKLITRAVSQKLLKHIKRSAEVSLSIVGNRKMQALNKTYRDRDYPTDVLSFPLSESADPKIAFVDLPDNVLRLGDIVISYPLAIQLAKDKNLLVDDAIIQLALHGLDHLLGIHHPE
ncbi:rRNA maturation RNase YbeY [Candidatus Gottesmanbacteria bacterium RBG_16_43_7]|uniref:Endoribonuclease YbeY n=1 Tax=Candidatus Gottesmanbacteria bacterium RBG_16_43_7 TaxID=1798373 RepID=A0A1F5ZBR1_9BACT|nr:MAG: rRNA maturation RNase YbeY [Candidatus Gottesmanbacteria bacterium RBG_16_43_7]